MMEAMTTTVPLRTLYVRRSSTCAVISTCTVISTADDNSADDNSADDNSDNGATCNTDDHS